MISDRADLMRNESHGALLRWSQPEAESGVLADSTAGSWSELLVHREAPCSLHLWTPLHCIALHIFSMTA